MFADRDLTGRHLPPRTLALTFDDGPGPDSVAVAEFLAERRIPAAFFLIGAHARSRPDAVRQVHRLGHVVGNHTANHPVLVPFARDGGDVVAEVAEAAATLADLAPAAVRFFRAPYGNWRDPDPNDPHHDGPTSSLAARLNASGQVADHVGPIGWDVDARDWLAWREGRPAESVGPAYLEAAEGAGRGIVLLHDSGESPALRAGNRCLDLVRWLVPRLVDRGFRFVGLDAALPLEPPGSP